MFRVCQGQVAWDAWNMLVAFPHCRMLEYSLDGHNMSLSAIRTVRVLRPLRAINRVPSEFLSFLSTTAYFEMIFFYIRFIIFHCFVFVSHINTDYEADIKFWLCIVFTLLVCLVCIIMTLYYTKAVIILRRHCSEWPEALYCTMPALH